jgi:F-type H+-transporting ATPase subunit alpha
VLGVALNLDVPRSARSSSATTHGIEEGQQVKRTGEILSVPGRRRRSSAGSIDPLGSPIDGLGDIEADERPSLELQAASVMQRQSVASPCRPASRPSTHDADRPRPASADHR